jgi:hypothetical protein
MESDRKRLIQFWKQEEESSRRLDGKLIDLNDSQNEKQPDPNLRILS